MGILTGIANGLKAIGALFGWAQQRDAEENTPTQQANAEAGQIQKDKTQAAQDVQNPDLTKLRDDVAE